jgi:hypothetical protein
VRAGGHQQRGEPSRQPVGGTTDPLREFTEKKVALSYKICFFNQEILSGLYVDLDDESKGGL